MIKSAIEPTSTGIRLNLYVQPNGKKSELLGLYNGRLKIRIQAPPVEGKANDAVVTFIAKTFKVPVRRVQLIRGQLSREKVVAIDGVSEEAARELLSSLLK